MRVLVGGSWVPTQSTRAVNSELTDFLSRGLMFLVLVRYPSFSVGGQCLPTLPVVFETLQFLCYSLCVAPCVQNTVRNTFYPKIWVRQRKLRPWRCCLLEDDNQNIQQLCFCFVLLAVARQHKPRLHRPGAAQTKRQTMGSSTNFIQYVVCQHKASEGRWA